MSRTLVHLLAVVAVLFAALGHPPGAMAVARDGAITFEICSEGALRTITLPAEGGSEERETADPTLCGFIAAQVVLAAPEGPVAPAAAGANEPAALPGEPLLSCASPRGLRHPRGPPSL